MPSNPTCHYHLGMAYLAAGNREAAQRSLQQALKSPGFLQPELARAALSKMAKSAH
jgi:Tfp pilus assembly protein PilF